MEKQNRGLHIKVKTAKRRKKSSTLWLERQLNDPYVRQAKIDGYRSRAAYKILEMDEKFHFFKDNMVIVDLGAAPGGWLQIAAKKSKNSTIIGLDLLDIAPIPSVTTIKCDFTEDEGLQKLIAVLGNKKVDLVLSDMAPSSCGHKATDHLRIMHMCELAFDFAKEHLKTDGCFLAKVLKGGTENNLLTELKKTFKTVKHSKPDSSRKESSEMYVVAMGFKNNEPEK